MRCPFCGVFEDKVIETRVSKDGNEIRRRRECEGCERRYTTYERIEESMPLVIKSDGRREPFDRTKIERGLLTSVAKRPVAREQIASLALSVEREVSELGVSEIGSRDIGERVLPRLRALDTVAYVRFASIYRDFRDLEGFAKELDALRQEDTGRHTLSDMAELAREDITDEHEPVPPSERTG
ncbi:MAG TPA: transcriptional regulator NrdR [Kofleriaceae bacterium]|jgi:transcriptional repressor NrdR|nr:transcriptional regulator NrdR [Kofleriaceae bacterium]